jgi:hypothetical protein
MLTGLLLIAISAAFDLQIVISDAITESDRSESIRVDISELYTLDCVNEYIRYQQLNVWIGYAPIRSTVLRPEASHTVAQLLSSHLRISSRVA